MKENYYKNKIKFLIKIFGTKNIKIDNKKIQISDKSYKIKNDVIIINDLEKDKLNTKKNKTVKGFGEEWFEFSLITSEHYNEYDNYFDIIDIDLNNKVVADFGCGIGRWSKLVIDKFQNIKTLILVDYSNAIFVARKHFYEYDNIIFIKADLEKLNFYNNSIDFFICLGVLHHLPSKNSTAIKNISNSSKEGLIYLYYNLDVRNKSFKYIFRLADYIRKVLSKSSNKYINAFISFLLTIIFYFPFILIVKLFTYLKIDTSNIPLNYYEKFSFYRVRQDAYDRFFTNIEHRYSQKEIKEIYGKYFKKFKFSKKAPFWHFYVEK